MMRLYAVAAAVAVLGLLAATWFLAFGRAPADRFAQCRDSVIAGGSASIGGPFTLVDGAGRTVTEADVIDRPALIYFGYTYCPDVCPLDAARNAEAVDLLAEQGLEVRPVFISVDPERDTPEVVGEYASFMHEDMVGLTGSPEQVAAAAQAYRTYYRAQDTGDAYYLVDHSTFTYLVLPEAGFVEFFRRDQTAEEIAERAACFITAA